MNFIKYFDLFEIKFHFYLNNQPNYQNIFGGLMTFIFCFICVLAFILCSIDDLKKLNPITSKSEIPDAGIRTVNILEEKIWIPFRMVTYEEQFVDHRGILFPLIYYVEGKWDNKTGMNLKYYLLSYKLCNETSMAKKPDYFKINVPLNELFCIDYDDLPFGGSWNGDYLYYLEYNLHLCQDGINFNVSDPRCTKLENLLQHHNTSWLFEFYYPVVQFQPTNFEVPLAVIYRSYFYRLATHANKVERIYMSQHILSDDRSLLNSQVKNSSIWGMNSLYGDDYYMEYNYDPIIKSTSSRLYSLDIYMDQGMIYYKRSYKKLFIIISDFFPILKLIMLILKKSTQHFKISESKRKLAGLLFENAEIKQKKRVSKRLDRLSYGSISLFANRLKVETYNNSKKELKNNNNNEKEDNFNNDCPNNVIEISKLNKRQKASNVFASNKSNNFNKYFTKKNSDSNIKNGISFNKSNNSLNNENIIQILNQKGITKLNSNKKTSFLFRDTKLKDSYSTHKKKNIIENKKEVLFPYYYFFLDLFFDKFTNPQKFCCVSNKYFTVYNFMCRIYDISTHIMLFKQFNVLNNFIFESINKSNNYYLFDNNEKININDKDLLEQVNTELKTTNNIYFLNTFLKH